jgi:hypothetical protein
MFCQSCGVEAPTKHVAFYQNIGALVMRFTRTIDGNLCKSCVHRHFWQFTLVNFTLGWWGVHSLIITPFFILNNLFRYLGCLGMPSAAGARRPELTPEAVQQIGPHTEEIIARLNRGERGQALLDDVAARAAVTPGQVALYIRELAAASQRTAQQGQAK